MTTVRHLEARADLLLFEESLGQAREEFEQAVHFAVVEVAVLADGRELVVGEAGWSSVPQGISVEELWQWLTVESVTRDVLNVVLPDDDDPVDEHPFAWIAEQLQEQGVGVTADELRAVPYEVRLSDRLRQRLSGA